MPSEKQTKQGQAWDQLAKDAYGDELRLGTLFPGNVEELDALIFGRRRARGCAGSAVREGVLPAPVGAYVMRRAAVAVSIKGHDVTLDLMPYLVSLTYTDKADEELDDLQIVLEDREGLWQGDWLPQAGDVIEASIQTENWREIGAVEELPCGKFEVDEMELESSAEGGDTVTVKAVPAAVKSSLMLQKKTRSWEKTPITTVIADIAGAAGLDTLYRGPGAGLRAG